MTYEPWLIEIVERASTIAERERDGYLPDAAATSPEKIDARIEEWCRRVARGDWELFARYLSWSGHDLSSIRPALGRVRLREGVALPGWAETVRDVFALASSMGERGDEAPVLPYERFLRPEEPLPFEEVLAPFVLVARRELATRAAGDCGLLSEEAHGALERSLLSSLSSFAADGLHLEFTIERARSASPLDRLVAVTRDPGDRTLYLAFVRGMLHGRLIGFFRELPVLARQLAVTTDLWVEATAELLGRLRADLGEIGHTFGGDADPGVVVELHASLSDPHRGRRTVMALTFASGLKLIYKPKNLGTEETFIRLLQWLNDRGAPLPFKLLKVLNRSSHGWVECVEHLPCRDQEEAARYYRRAGMLLCLLHVLEVTDGHHENLIASGEHPVLIDMETVLQHRGVRDEDDHGRRAVTLASEQLEQSVLRTGLLPMWQLPGDRRVAFDISGLGSGDSDARFQVLTWDGANTDRMDRAYQTRTAERQQNTPRLGDDPLHLTDHADELADGFQQMYRFLQSQRDALLAPGSPLHELGDQHVRYIFRGTRIYFGIRRKLADPSYLRDGADWSIGLEMLALAALPLTASDRAAGKQSTFWPVFAAERDAMVQGDIPIFTARPDSADLVLPGSVLQSCFTEPSLEIALRRLRTLGDEDLEHQLGFIRGALYTHVAQDRVAAVPAGIGGHEAELGTPTVLDREALVAEASAIARQIQARAIEYSDGSAAWIVPHLVPQAKRYQLLPAGYDLYDGATGIGLFLAAFERVTGGAGYRELALGAVQPVRRAVWEYGDTVVRDTGIGGAAGVGSMAYALFTMSRLLDEPALMDDARRLACLIRQDHVDADTALDVISGAAGAILCLLALYEATSDRDILSTAVICGRHLVKEQVDTGRGGHAWRDSHGTYLTGFSHGAAGMAYALLRLHGATADAGFRQAAEQAIAYETSVFSPDAGNWPDLREDEEQPVYMTRWCHGAPGIGLARLGGLPVLDTPGIRADIEIALETTQCFHDSGPDYPCCGTLGRVDFLLTASADLGRPSLADAANAEAAQVVSRARRRGSYALHPLLPDDLYAPGFFQGTSGIGYELLRLAYPEVLPSILLWR